MASTNMYESVLGLGDDQLAGQWQLTLIGLPASVTGKYAADKIALRIDQPFDIPEIATGEYEFHTLGLRFTRPSKLEETDKHITLQVRVDQKWEAFDALWEWRKLVYNYMNNGGAATNATYGDTFSATAQIEYLNKSNEVVKTFTLQNAILKNILIGTLDPASNEPTRLTLNLIFGRITWDKQ